jgi:hypothetical protein
VKAFLVTISSHLSQEPLRYTIQPIPLELADVFERNLRGVDAVRIAQPTPTTVVESS